MKSGTKSLLMGPKHFIIRPIYIIKAWKALYNQRAPTFSEIFIVIIQFLGFWGKNLNSKKAESQRIKFASKIAELISKEEVVNFRFGVSLEEALTMIHRTVVSDKWIILKAKEELNPTITIISLKDNANKGRLIKLVENSSKESTIGSGRNLSPLYFANKESIKLMPKWLLKLMFSLSKDEEANILQMPK